MTPRGPGKSWQDFLTAHVRGIDDLEVLLLLESAKEPLEAEDVADRLPGVAEVRDVLNHLIAGGLVQAVEPRRFAVRSTGEVRDGVARIRRRYVRNRADVLRVLDSNALARIRSSAADLFARTLRSARKDRDPE